MKTLLLMTLALTSTLGISAFAQPRTHHPITQEHREKLAVIHEKMAACLRSAKPISDCRTEMHEHCMTMMGRESCPMMGEIGSSDND